MDIRLLVLRTGDTKRLADFYSLFGLTFDYHKHDNSPFHYSASIGQTILEIYPLTKNQTEPDKNLRLGFNIDNFDDTIQKLRKLNIPFSLEPTQTDFGFMTIISDPDDRKIELYKSNQLKAIKILITSFIDDHQPGFVECKFHDAYGKEHIVQDKVPIVTEKDLDANSYYPQDGVIACEILKIWHDSNGQKILRVNTSKPWGVDSIDGLTEFDVFEQQLIDLER